MLAGTERKKEKDEVELLHVIYVSPSREPDDERFVSGL
jgi:hypothetical protein